VPLKIWFKHNLKKQAEKLSKILYTCIL